MLWLALALLAGSLLLARWITDGMWFASLGYLPLFWTPLVWEWGVWAACGLFTLAVLWLNVSVARPALARAYLRLENAPRLSWTWQQLRRGLVTATAVVGFLWAGSVAGRWPVLALWWHRRPFGLSDPIFRRDVSFYVFDLPAATLVLDVVAAAALLSLGLAALIYTAAGLLAWRLPAGGVHGRARRHLLVLVGVLVILVGVSVWLSRYELLFSPGGVVFGATYTDVHVRLPLRTAAAVLFVAAGVLVFPAAWGWRPWLAAGCGLLAVAVSLGGELAAGVVQRLWVRPNELARERPFIEHHIAMTRLAHRLEGMQEVDFEASDVLDEASARQAAALLGEVRLWDWRPLGTALSQLQLFRPYYQFVDVDVDRYPVGGRLRQVMLAARELATERLQNPSWVNLRLQYTHGYGAVMVPVSEVTPAGLPRLAVRDLPPQSEPGWPRITRPQIYFGQAPAEWVVAPTRLGEFDYPSGERNVMTRYQGRDGVPVGKVWNRLLFAVRFRSVELLLSRELQPDSRVLMYRSVPERLQRLFPYVRYDQDPYLVVTDQGHLVWLADAYTVTDRFPYSRPVRGWGNYVRNSIKAAVDAYDGTVSFYLADPTDPIAQALQGLFGQEVVRPLSQMPEDLRRHLRYPEELFTVQARVAAVYHMRDPAVFYNQEDRWDLPREIYGESEVPMQPYYAMVDLGQGPEFALLLPFVAAGRQNMVAWMVARMDPGRYGQLVLYRFPKQALTYGPMQVEARINQDPDISRELTLWGQRGSRVLRGNLIVVPVGRTLLYVEPLFLVSEQSQLPELRRVVVSTGTRLAMAATLTDALQAVLRQGTAVAAQPDALSAPQAPAGAAGPGAWGGALPGPQPGAGAAGGAAAGTASASARTALEQLLQARRSLEQGDWEGFGRAMQRLEQTLRELAAPGQASSSSP